MAFCVSTQNGLLEQCVLENGQCWEAHMRSVLVCGWPVGCEVPGPPLTFPEAAAGLQLRTLMFARFVKNRRGTNGQLNPHSSKPDNIDLQSS